MTQQQQKQKHHIGNVKIFVSKLNYSSVFSKPSHSPYDTTIKDPNVPTITDIEITEEDIIAMIDELSNTSASGADGLTSF